MWVVRVKTKKERKKITKKYEVNDLCVRVSSVTSKKVYNLLDLTFYFYWICLCKNQSECSTQTNQLKKCKKLKTIDRMQIVFLLTPAKMAKKWNERIKKTNKQNYLKPKINNLFFFVGRQRPIQFKRNTNRISFFSSNGWKLFSVIVCECITRNIFEKRTKRIKLGKPKVVIYMKKKNSWNEKKNTKLLLKEVRRV